MRFFLLVIRAVGLLLIVILSSCTRRMLSTVEYEIPANIANIKIQTGSGFVGPCEPSISISPVDPNFVVAGAVLDNLYVSHDGGSTWKTSRLKSSFGVYGDPVVMFDQKEPSITPIFLTLKAGLIPVKNFWIGLWSKHHWMERIFLMAASLLPIRKRSRQTLACS